MNIHKIVFMACGIFQIADGAAENALSLREGLTNKFIQNNSVNLVEESAKPTNLLVRTCPKKTVACMECTGCAPGCTLCCACTLLSCATTPTCLASWCIMALSTSGACGIKASLANIATNVCLSTCVPGMGSLICCWPPALTESSVPPALMLDRKFVEWSDDLGYDETQEVEPLLDTASVSLQLQRQE